MFSGAPDDDAGVVTATSMAPARVVTAAARTPFFMKCNNSAPIDCATAD